MISIFIMMGLEPGPFPHGDDKCELVLQYEVLLQTNRPGPVVYKLVVPSCEVLLSKV